MAELDVKENCLVGFPNDKKGNDKAPDWKVTVNDGGKIRELAIWIRESQNGKPYMSGKVGDPFVPKSSTSSSKPASRQQAPAIDEMDVPF